MTKDYRKNTLVSLQCALIVVYGEIDTGFRIMLMCVWILAPDLIDLAQYINNSLHFPSCKVGIILEATQRGFVSRCTWNTLPRGEVRLVQLPKHHQVTADPVLWKSPTTSLTVMGGDRVSSGQFYSILSPFLATKFTATIALWVGPRCLVEIP